MPKSGLHENHLFAAMFGGCAFIALDVGDSQLQATHDAAVVHVHLHKPRFIGLRRPWCCQQPHHPDASCQDGNPHDYGDCDGGQG